MSPRARAQGIRWRLIGPAIGLWLLAVVALSAIASPATASDAPPRRTATTVERVQPASRAVTAEAPILTLLLAGVGIASLTAPQARRAVARRHAR